jgi:hypothetical protein
MPILRPLIGDDKLEIVDVAPADRDTMDISILPDQDCCSLFVPKHPETESKSDTSRTLGGSLGRRRGHEACARLCRGSARIPIAVGSTAHANAQQMTHEKIRQF